MPFLHHDEIECYFHHCKCNELSIFLMSQLSDFLQKGNAIQKVYTIDYYAKATEAHSGISKNIYKSTKQQKHLQVCQQLLSHLRNLFRYVVGNV